MSDKTIVRLSSTALGNAGCILKLHRTVVEGYKEPLPNAKAIYGVAIHKFIDTMFKSKGNYGTAVTAAKLSFNIPKTEEVKQAYLCDERHLLTTCFNLWSTWVEEDKNFDVLILNDKPATEITFSIKYYEDEHVIIYLEGTIDTLGQIVGGCFAIRDWKSTSSWDERKYLKRYELSRQLRFYVLACKLMSEKEPDSVLGKIGSTRIGAIIDAIFIKQDPNLNVVKRSECYQFSDSDINAFRMTLDDYIQKISFHIRTGYLPKEGILNGSCEQKYGFCPFWNVCRVEEKLGNILLARDFKKVPFTPLNYSGVE